MNHLHARQNTVLVEQVIGLKGRSLWFLHTAKQVNVTTAELDLKIAVFFQKFHDLVFSLLHAYACTYVCVTFLEWVDVIHIFPYMGNVGVVPKTVYVRIFI